jgi:hypothetical protein
LYFVGVCTGRSAGSDPVRLRGVWTGPGFSMVAATDGVARKFAAYVDEPVLAAEPRKGFFVRFMEALMETRRRQARREIAKRAHLLDDSWRQLDL